MGSYELETDTQEETTEVTQEQEATTETQEAAEAPAASGETQETAESEETSSEMREASEAEESKETKENTEAAEDSKEEALGHSSDYYKRKMEAAIFTGDKIAYNQFRSNYARALAKENP